MKILFLTNGFLHLRKHPHLKLIYIYMHTNDTYIHTLRHAHISYTAKGKINKYHS